MQQNTQGAPSGAPRPRGGVLSSYLSSLHIPHRVVYTIHLSFLLGPKPVAVYIYGVPQPPIVRNRKFCIQTHLLYSKVVPGSSQEAAAKDHGSLEPIASLICGIWGA